MHADRRYPARSPARAVLSLVVLTGLIGPLPSLADGAAGAVAQGRIGVRLEIPPRLDVLPGGAGDECVTSRPGSGMLRAIDDHGRILGACAEAQTREAGSSEGEGGVRRVTITPV
jgi:hypothetical protein